MKYDYLLVLKFHLEIQQPVRELKPLFPSYILSNKQEWFKKVPCIAKLSKIKSALLKASVSQQMRCKFSELSNDLISLQRCHATSPQNAPV